MSLQTNPRAYHIHVNEYQRGLIEQVFAFALDHPGFRRLLEQQPGEWEDNRREEAEALWELWAKLPQAERETPDALHGFCV